MLLRVPSRPSKRAGGGRQAPCGPPSRVPSRGCCLRIGKEARLPVESPQPRVNSKLATSASPTEPLAEGEKVSTGMSCPREEARKNSNMLGRVGRCILERYVFNAAGVPPNNMMLWVPPIKRWSVVEGVCPEQILRTLGAGSRTQCGGKIRGNFWHMLWTCGIVTAVIAG